MSLYLSFYTALAPVLSERSYSSSLSNFPWTLNIFADLSFIPDVLFLSSFTDISSFLLMAFLSLLH